MDNINFNGKVGKLFAIADIHINDYPDRNPTPMYRLKQCRKVCQQIVTAAKKEGATRIVIAGDTMEKFQVRPYILAEVKNFLWELMSHFEEGWIIWGNHDQDNKGKDSEFHDSCLSVMLPPNLHYGDCKEVVIGGVRIGFMNWRSEFDLSWIKGKLDVLFTHATISYSDNDRYNSQILDESKFDIAFCGDIHSAKQKGKYVSIGIPQKAKMSDSDDATGVVIDLATKQWKWVDLDPGKELMKFSYTDDQTQEGWHPDIGTWKVYQPSGTSVVNGIKNIKIPAWENVAKLIDNAIIVNGLSDVHAQVLQGMDKTKTKEVDFNFTLKRLYAKNWRSIEEQELFFDQYDKVKIVGANGSGKSSLLLALKYAFIKNSDYKSLTQFGSKDCRVEVDFIYQGINYRLIRGTGSKNYGLLIDGVAQKYNSKAVFDEDVNTRFPFISYMEDVMFLNSDHPRFIGSIEPQRRSEIISRFYKLDMLDLYNEQAEIMAKNYMNTGQSWKDQLEQTAKVLTFIEDKLSLIQIPALTVQELNQKKFEGQQIQAAWLAYNNYVQNQSSLVGALEAATERLSELKSQAGQFGEISDIDSQLQEAQQKLNWFNQASSALQAIVTEGKRLRAERNDLDIAKVCRTCGHPITQANLAEHKAELDGKIDECMARYYEVEGQIQNSGLSLEVLQSFISTKMAEKTQILNYQRELSTTEDKVTRLQNQLSSLGPVPEKIELPFGFLEQMGQIEADLKVWEQRDGLLKDRQEAQEKMMEYQTYLTQLQGILEKLKSYIDLTGPCGKIYEEIMLNLSKEFSDNKVKYAVERFKGRGYKTERLNLTSYYILGDNQVAYDNCSDGQKTILDLDYMSKVLTKIGVLVLDEALKYLDSAKLDEALETIKQMDVGLVLLSSHVESLGRFNNKTLNLALDSNGRTIMQLT